jgi:ribosomal protein L2
VRGSRLPIYIGPGATFPMREVPSGVVVHVEVEKIYGQGQWRGEIDDAS